VPEIQVILVRIARRPGQIAMFDRSFEEDISVVLSPDVVAERYNRSWRLSQPIKDSGFLVGKLGFTRQLEETSVEYDEDAHDFVELDSLNERGTYSHWALDLRSQLMAFEIHPPDIRQKSFTGALAAILDQNTEYRFTVELLSEEAAFFQWLTTIEKLIRFKAVMRPPNPHWGERMAQLEDILEPTEADQVTVDLKVDPSKRQGLQARGTIIEQAVRHSEDGYGSIIADGLVDGTKRTYNSRDRLRSRRIDSLVSLISESAWRALQAILRPQNGENDDRVESGSRSTDEKV
jgi:hypothetical protein